MNGSIKPPAPAAVRTAATAIHFALLNEPQTEWEGLDNLRRQEEIIRRASANFVVAESAEQADIIVFLESNNFKNRHQIPLLLNESLVRDYPQKCYAISYTDSPVTFFPGVYTSLPRKLHRAEWSRAGGYYVGNPAALASEYERRPWNPRHLFSFRGAMSHPLRRDLLKRAATWGAENPITWINRWCNHTETEQREYLREIVDSAFVLCPRGIAPSTHRLFETMRLGRAPVVLSDDWAPPAGPDWESFSVFVPESDIDALPRILGARQNEAEAMGLRARQAWEKYFAPDTILPHQITALRDLAVTRAHLPAPDFNRLWHSRAFWRDHGWLFHQRLCQRLGHFLHSA